MYSCLIMLHFIILDADTPHVFFNLTYIMFLIMMCALQMVAGWLAWVFVMGTAIKYFISFNSSM